MKIVICGASGYLGRVLSTFLSGKGYELVLISRSDLDYELPPNTQYVRWDGETIGEWAEEFETATAIINFAGRSVNCRHNKENRKQILDSRIQTTRLIAQAIQRAKVPPKLLLNASGTSIYRDEFERDVDEETGVLGDGFLAEVGKAWEAALFEEELPSTRRVALRLSMVLGSSSPVFNVFKKLSKFYLGGAQGNGQQYVSWIHESDCLRAILFLLQNETNGPVNLCSPYSLPNRDFQRGIRENLGVRFGLPIPEVALKVGALLLQTESELTLRSRRATPKRLLDADFQFEFPTWEAACRNIVKG